jgi:large subunit ribosomal protein L17
MLHGNKVKQLSRKSGQRNALVKTLAVSFVKHESIKTSETKAKVLKAFIEKLITKGKKGDMNAIRLISSYVGAAAATKIVKNIAPRYADRKGGYTRVIKLQTRLSDGTKMSQISLV